MYCPSCGTAVNQSKSFCNVCGSKLPGAKDESLESVQIRSLIFGIVAIFVFGMITTLGFMALMKKFQFNEGLINGFILLILTLITALEGSFMWLLFSRMKGTKAVNPDLLRVQTIKDLSAVTTENLPEFGSSITDHTTHRLKPVLQKQPKTND